MLELVFNEIFMTGSDLLVEGVASDFPWLSLSILFPIVGAFIVPFFPDEGEGKQVRWFALAISLITFLITVAGYINGYDSSIEGLQLAERVSWLPDLGLTWAVGADGLSMPLILLTSFITALAVLAAWPVTFKPKLFFFLINHTNGSPAFKMNHIFRNKIILLHYKFINSYSSKIFFYHLISK